MADALAAAAVSAIAAAFSLQLLAKCAGDIRRARTDIEATRLEERLYEEARLEDASELVSSQEGRAGALQWRRTGVLIRQPVGNLTDEVIPVRLRLEIVAGARTVTDLEAVVLPAAATGRAGSPSPKS